MKKKLYKRNKFFPHSKNKENLIKLKFYLFFCYFIYNRNDLFI